MSPPPRYDDEYDAFMETLDRLTHEPDHIMPVDPDADAVVAQLAAPQTPADVYRHLATMDPAQPCRDLPGILDAIRNVAGLREPPVTVPTILVELARLDGEP